MAVYNMQAWQFFYNTEKTHLSSTVNSQPFSTAEGVTEGLYNPRTKLNTCNGEDAAGAVMSISFPPKRRVNYPCSNCKANITIKKNTTRTSYRSKNISNFQCRLTTSKGNWIEGVFSFTAKKAIDDIVEIKKEKFGGKLQ